MDAVSQPVSHAAASTAAMPGGKSTGKLGATGKWSIQSHVAHDLTGKVYHPYHGMQKSSHPESKFFNEIQTKQLEQRKLDVSSASCA
jgi:hypothetical protein